MLSIYKKWWLIICPIWQPPQQPPSIDNVCLIFSRVCLVKIRSIVCYLIRRVDGAFLSFDMWYFERDDAAIPMRPLQWCLFCCWNYVRCEWPHRTISCWMLVDIACGAALRYIARTPNIFGTSRSLTVCCVCDWLTESLGSPQSRRARACPRGGSYQCNTDEDGRPASRRHKRINAIVWGHTDSYKWNISERLLYRKVNCYMSQSRTCRSKAIIPSRMCVPFYLTWVYWMRVSSFMQIPDN